VATGTGNCGLVMLFNQLYTMKIQLF
jgi:hypothetical protein